MGLTFIFIIIIVRIIMTLTLIIIVITLISIIFGIRRPITCIMHRLGRRVGGIMPYPPLPSISLTIKRHVIIFIRGIQCIIIINATLFSLAARSAMVVVGNMEVA